MSEKELGTPPATKGVRVQLQPAVERTDEAALAIRIAGVKLILAILNIAIIMIDDSVPISGTPYAYAQAISITGIFLAYMLVSYVALRKNWVSIQFYRVTIPFVDVIFCGLLILGTDGYLSPFNLWLAQCLVAASFCSDQRIVLSATGLALGVEVLIASIPQETPLVLPAFVVRSGFLLSFGLVIASIGNFVARKSAFLGAMDAYASKAAQCDSVSDASANLLEHIVTCLRPKALVLELDEGGQFFYGDAPADELTLEMPVASGTVQYGRIRIAPSTSPTSEERRLLHTMLDRFTVSLRRFANVDSLRRSAAQEARLRLADELHDTHVQTLAAIDFQVESMLKNDVKKGDLLKIRNLARQSIVDLRDFIAKGPILSTDDLEEIIARSTRNWKGEFSSHSDADVYLSRSAWLAIEVLIREGLSNARQHANADWARFSLTHIGSGWRASLETNGVAPVLPLKRRGYGLTRVAEAVAGAGGEMEFKAGSNEGAVLSATFSEVSD